MVVDFLLPHFFFSAWLEKFCNGVKKLPTSKWYVTMGLTWNPDQRIFPMIIFRERNFLNFRNEMLSSSKRDCNYRTSHFSGNCMIKSATFRQGKASFICWIGLGLKLFRVGIQGSVKILTKKLLKIWLHVPFESNSRLHNPFP